MPTLDWCVNWGTWGTGADIADGYDQEAFEKGGGRIPLL